MSLGISSGGKFSIVLVLLVCFFLGACSPLYIKEPTAYQQRLEEFSGKNISELVTAIGAPDTIVKKDNNTTIYRWHSVERDQNPFWWNGVLECYTAVEIDSATRLITTVYSDGNSCVQF